MTEICGRPIHGPISYEQTCSVCGHPAWLHPLPARPEKTELTIYVTWLENRCNRMAQFLRLIAESADTAVLRQVARQGLGDYES